MQSPGLTVRLYFLSHAGSGSHDSRQHKSPHHPQKQQMRRIKHIKEIFRLASPLSVIEGKSQKGWNTAPVSYTHLVWIDSQTEEEILRGIREAKDLSEYDNLASAAYLRAKEDYLMGINFSRLLTLKYGNTISGYLNTPYTVISVGRVMTCVLGMVVRREREIRDFVKTPFYRVLGDFGLHGRKFEGEWRAVSGDVYKRQGQSGCAHYHAGHQPDGLHRRGSGKAESEDLR